MFRLLLECSRIMFLLRLLLVMLLRLLRSQILLRLFLMIRTRLRLISYDVSYYVSSSFSSRS